MAYDKIAIVRDASGKIVDAERIDSTYSYGLASIASEMQPGESIEVHPRRLSQDDQDRIAKAEADKVRAKEIADARALIAEVDGLSVPAAPKTDDIAF